MTITKEDEAIMLTTMDNPFNPFIQYNEWYAYDVNKGYNTCAYLARLVGDLNPLEELEAESIIKQKIQEIVDLNLLGNYCKITENGDKLII